MATLVKFVIDKERRLQPVAVFPQLKYNKILYGNDLITCYAYVGQHSSCSKAWVKEQVKATPEEYNYLKLELERIGYNLKICK